MKGLITNYHPVFYPSVMYVYKAGAQGIQVAIDSTFISPEGHFTFTGCPLPKPGIVYLGAKNCASRLLIASPGEVLQITVDAKELQDANFIINGSAENNLYSQMELLRSALDEEQKQRDSLVKTIDPFHPKYNTITTPLREAFIQKAKETNKQLAALQATQPASFAAGVLAGLFMYPVKETVQWLICKR